MMKYVDFHQVKAHALYNYSILSTFAYSETKSGIFAYLQS